MDTTPPDSQTTQTTGRQSYAQDSTAKLGSWASSAVPPVSSKTSSTGLPPVAAAKLPTTACIGGLQSLPLQSLSLTSPVSTNTNSSNAILTIHKNRSSAAEYAKIPKADFFSYCLKLAGSYDSCCVIFASDSERDDFISNQCLYSDEGNECRVSVYDNFAEVKMMVSFIHGGAAQDLGLCLVLQITENFFVAGTHIFDTGLMFGGSSGQKIGVGKKRPDMSLGFAALEDRPFAMAEIGYSDSGDLTRQRMMNWMQDALGEIRLGFAVVIDTIYDENISRQSISKCKVDVYHMIGPASHTAGSTEVCSHLIQLDLLDPQDRQVQIPRRDIMPDSLPTGHLPLINPLPRSFNLDLTHMFERAEKMLRWHKIHSS